jgi:hypothetical protein
VGRCPLYVITGWKVGRFVQRIVVWRSPGTNLIQLTADMAVEQLPQVLVDVARDEARVRDIGSSYSVWSATPDQGSLSL